ncbi:MAG TPA: hypothetical protein DCR55_07065, partial [Lentisphaeria bacterium]|nr:hypothetical protein [Lentisphaeria bacterium]
MTWREQLFLTAVALLVVLVLALIPAGSHGARERGQASPVAWDTVRDDPQATMDLSWMGIIAHLSGKEGSWIERNLEQKFNINIEPTFLDWNGVRQRRPLMLCGG